MPKLRHFIQILLLLRHSININMSNPYFKFKKFTIWHDKCAMKVGTDGSLLGAWADTTNCHRALDVGTGTGLIALMLAQRCDAVIDAIDIDIDACDQARENIAQSPFATQIQVHLSPFANYKPKADIKYDLIISNPPYFIDSLKCPNKQRNTARHTDTLSLADLLKDSCRLLAPKGKLALILPFEQRTILLELAHKNQLYPLRETHVSSIKGATPKRLLIELSRQRREFIEPSTLNIEIEQREYSKEFIALVKDFYLKM